MLEQRLSAADIRIDGLQTRVVQQHTQQQSNTAEFASGMLCRRINGVV